MGSEGIFKGFLRDSMGFRGDPEGFLVDFE